jgi:hypothetical protein
VEDRGDANGLIVIGQLIDNAVGADSQRTQHSQPTAQLVSCSGVALEQAEGALDGVDQRPVEVEQLTASAAREDDTSHNSALRPTLSELAADILQCDRLIARELKRAGLDRGERVGIGEDLCGLLERFVLVDWNEHRGRLPFRVTSTWSRRSATSLSSSLSLLRNSRTGTIFATPAVYEIAYTTGGATGRHGAEAGWSVPRCIGPPDAGGRRSAEAR